MTIVDHRNEELANRLFTAIERSDTAAIESMWADDVKVWHTGDACDNNRARALKVIRWFIDNTTQRDYEVLDRRFFDGGFVQQHVLRADAINGASITLRVCIVIKVDNGLITRIDEYFDPADMAALLRSTT
jgi:ketosteroid isomerase-like protein